MRLKNDMYERVKLLMDADRAKNLVAACPYESNAEVYTGTAQWAEAADMQRKWLDRDMIMWYQRIICGR